MLRIGMLTSLLARTAALRPAVAPASRATSTRRAAAADPFADNRAPIVLYDGVCRMCNFWVDWVLDNDPTAKLRFAALQSPAGRRLLERSGRKPDDISSIVLVTPDEAFIKSEAVLEIGKQLSITTPLATIAQGVVPRAIADAAYDAIANNRYNIAGKRSYRDSDARLAERFLSED